jgi:hypothetical protein
MTAHSPAAPAGKYPDVRLATINDSRQLLDMALDLHAENGVMPLSKSRVVQTLDAGIEGKRAIIGVIGKPGHLEGMIYLTISNFYYSDEFHISELFNYVKPEFRRSRNAQSLIKFAQRSAEQLGCPLMIGVLSNERTEAKIRLYQRLLGKFAGAFFAWNLGSAPDVQHNHKH